MLFCKHFQLCLVRCCETVKASETFAFKVKVARFWDALVAIIRQSFCSQCFLILVCFQTNQHLLCKLRAIVASLLVTKPIRHRFWFNAHFCKQFHLATANNVQQPLANLSGNAHFSLATGSCQHVANQCRNHYEATDSQRWCRWKSMPLLLWTQTLIRLWLIYQL